ncbi:MAG: thioredoxin [Muribaculaceae bacterium]|nr:thioredoxin [Muribaculaceae bacterium]MBR6432525.1 thioredoxin [Muribaculaceae bacterium]
MKRFLILSLLTVVLFGVTSCVGNSSNGEESKTISAKMENTLDEATLQIDSLKADEDTVAQADKKEIKKNNGKAKIVVIDFFATWCGPCKAMAPVIEKMEKKYSDKIEFRKVDIDQDTELARQYQIKGVPTLVILSSEGEVLNKIVGAQAEDYLDKMFSDL